MVAKRHLFVPKCYLESFSVKNAKKKKSNLCAFDAVEEIKLLVAQCVA